MRNVERDPRVVLSVEGTGLNSYGLKEYLVVHGRARVEPGGAAAPLQRLAHVYLGPDVVFPAPNLDNSCSAVASDRIAANPRAGGGGCRSGEVRAVGKPCRFAPARLCAAYERTVRGSPKCSNRAVSANQVIAATASPSSVRTNRPAGLAIPVCASGV
jgi:hypothetical protein